MFSCLERVRTGRRLLLPLLAVTAAAGGCAQKAREPYVPPPLVVDEAMQRRDFERSVAFYPNGDTVSGANRFPIRSDVDDVGDNTYAAALFDLAASAAQTVALPFTYLFVPPFAPAVYHGEDVPPSYTAMPPMRPPIRPVTVDGLLVNPDTLEVTPRRKPGGQIYGPTGPSDSEFMSSDPVPAEGE